MKFTLLLFLSITLCSSLTGCKSSPQSITDEQAITELRQFYANYMKAKAAGTKEGYNETESLLQLYATPRLTEQLKEQDEEGYDFILFTNGAQSESVNTLKVTKDPKEKDIYHASWLYLGWGYIPYETITIKLQLVKTPTGILIDRLISLSGQNTEGKKMVKTW